MFPNTDSIKFMYEILIDWTCIPLVEVKSSAVGHADDLGVGRQRPAVEGTSPHHDRFARIT